MRDGSKKRRMPRWRKILLGLLIITLIWTLSLFIAPMTLEPGTVRHLHGRANVVDYSSLWSELPPYQRTIYWFGDLNCHQIEERTIIINGNQMPVCARDVATFIGASLGIVIALMSVPAGYASLTFLYMFPQRIHEPVLRKMKPWMFVLLCAILMVIPLALDGFTQMLTGYESTNTARLITGLPYGMFGGMIVSALLASIAYNPRGDNIPPAPKE